MRFWKRKQIFREGQVWKYMTRPGEEQSRIFIYKVQKAKGYGAIVHICADGLSIKNPYLESGCQSVLPHAPMSEEALRSSVTEIDAVERPAPDGEEGYLVWKEAFDAGEAGVFTISVAEIIEYIQGVVSGGNGA